MPRQEATGSGAPNVPPGVRRYATMRARRVIGSAMRTATTASPRGDAAAPSVWYSYSPERTSGSVTGAPKRPPGSRSATRTSPRRSTAAIAAPPGWPEMTGHDNAAPPSGTVPAGTGPPASARSSSIPSFVQRDSSPGAPVARTHVATPATGRNGSSPNVSARAGAAASSASTAAASNRISGP